MNKHIFRWSVILYFILLPYVCFSLSMPPADLPFFSALFVLATCALLASKQQTRRWKIICIEGLAFAVLGIGKEIIAGRQIKALREHESERVKP